ncbi:ATP-binding protein [Streptomyces sp. PU-14G]|uniref:ATP-binding protein n=1 Tax=Streptomyces sp. PU-14G TaxID=2800808 RepID=UPI0034E02AC2
MEAFRRQCPPLTDVFVQRFSATRRGARLARRLAAYQLHAWGFAYQSPFSEKVTLVVAELSANAVVHGRVPGRDFEVRVFLEGEGATGAAAVRVEVSDTHPSLPVRRAPDSVSEGGLGLVLVDTLASCWGVRPRTGPGKTVWARVEVACPAVRVGGGT